MYRQTTGSPRKLGISLTAALLLFGTSLAIAEDASPDAAIADWLGKEITINTSTIDDHIPLGGKMTFIFDSDENVVRVCTRNVVRQRTKWREDMAAPCGVVLTFTRGTRYCTAEDVKAGNAEVLASCHRLRSREVALHPAAVKGAMELHDLLIFPLRASGGKVAISILVDSPSRVTHGGTAGGHN